MPKNTKTSRGNTAILGAGLEGRALERWFSQGSGVPTHLLDEATDPKAFQGLDQYDLVYRSPGIPLARPDMQALQKAGKLSSLTRLVFDEAPCPIIGVTGTKGKGTTSTLITEILKAAGKDVHLGGNIGVPATELLPKLTPESWLVLELSSFQLEDLHKSPHIAVLLNVTSEHLDVHPTVEAYRAAKSSLLKHQGPQDHLVYNTDYEVPREMTKQSPAQKHPISTSSSGDCSIQDGEIVWRGERVASASDVALRGTHNLENVLPAVAVAKLLGVENDTIQKVLREFKGLPHRLEPVPSEDGLLYINDSFSTTPETSIAAVKAFEEPVHLVAGGSEKNSDFTEWGLACSEAKNLKSIILMGVTADRMQASLSSDAPVLRAQSLKEAIVLARRRAQKGDVILMSPACASFDMFKNYKDRGEQFKSLARQNSLGDAA